MKALLLLTSILAISAPVQGEDYYSLTQTNATPFFHDHETTTAIEIESSVFKESILYIQKKGTGLGSDIKTLIFDYNYISFTDEQYDNYFSDYYPPRSVYFSIKIQRLSNGEILPTHLYQEDYGLLNMPYSLTTLNTAGITYIDYTNGTKTAINSLQDDSNYHITFEHYLPIKNFQYPSQIGDNIAPFVFGVYFSNAKHYAYLLEENFDEVFHDGYVDGYVDGYDDGYYIGVDDGKATQVNEEMGSFFIILRQAFNSIASILAIQLFPGFTLGLLLFIPLIFGIAYTLIKFLLGGG